VAQAAQEGLVGLAGPEVKGGEEASIAAADLPALTGLRALGAGLVFKVNQAEWGPSPLTRVVPSC
jgi:hypothetical protein